jgi:polysaccharide pyruvyl transferase WcaK-like protein
MKRIGFLGAYSIDNAGDQLLGYAVRQVFRERFPRAEQVLLAPAFRGNLWRHAWDATRGIDAPIQRVAPDDNRWSKGLDAVVIGGGGIIRLEPDFRPFLLGDAERWRRDVPAAWNAVGAEPTPAYLTSHREDYARVAKCCQTLSYVSVRNAVTARFVQRCGFRGDVHVVPDPVMQLSVPEDDTGERILRAAGVDTSAFVVGLSVGAALRDPRATHFFKGLFEALAGLVAKRAIEVVVFPFGEIYGDSDVLGAVQSAVPGAHVVRQPLGSLDRWRLIGALDLYLCARYHAMIAAFAQDVPFLVMDEYLSDASGSSKIREFIVDCGLEALYLAPYISTRPGAKLDNLLSLVDGLSFAEPTNAMRVRLAKHYDQMATALRL